MLPCNRGDRGQQGWLVYDGVCCLVVWSGSTGVLGVQRGMLLTGVVRVNRGDWCTKGYAAYWCGMGQQGWLVYDGVCCLVVWSGSTGVLGVQRGMLTGVVRVNGGDWCTKGYAAYWCGTGQQGWWVYKGVCCLLVWYVSTGVLGVQRGMLPSGVIRVNRGAWCTLTGGIWVTATGWTRATGVQRGMLTDNRGDPYCCCWSLLYSTILHSQADSLPLHVILCELVALYSAFWKVYRNGVLTALA